MTTGTAAQWASLPKAMAKSVSDLQSRLQNDAQWQAFVDTKGIVEPVTMGILSTGTDDAILVTVGPGKTSTSSGSSSKADFTLNAQPQQWEQFFSANPVAPYTSWVGLQVCDIQSYRSS
jgi:hypothetical protein